MEEEPRVEGTWPERTVKQQRIVSRILKWLSGPLFLKLSHVKCTRAAEHIVHIRWPRDLHVRKGVRLRNLTARRPKSRAALNTNPLSKNTPKLMNAASSNTVRLRNSTAVWQMEGNDNEDQSSAGISQGLLGNFGETSGLVFCAVHTDCDSCSNWSLNQMNITDVFSCVTPCCAV